MSGIDFSSWFWTYTNTTHAAITLSDGTVIEPGETHPFHGVSPDSAGGAEAFLDSYTNLVSHAPAGAVVPLPDFDEALRQAREQAPAYASGGKRVIVTPDSPAAFDPALNDGRLEHPEQREDLVDRPQPPPNTAAELTKTLNLQLGELPPKSAPPGEKEDRSADEARAKTHGGDPVDLFSGEFILEKVDFDLPSIGFPFRFVRTYRSGRRFFGPFGYNWDHSYNVYLRQLNDGRIAVNTGRLQEDLYVDSGDTILFNAPRGIFATLERQPASSTYDFILTFKDGTRQAFARPSGWSHPERIPLVAIEDTHANTQQLIYGTSARLESVVDTAGRTIELVYGVCGLLEALRPAFLQTPGSKPIQVQYLHATDIEHLSAVVTMPTPDFPSGLMTCYEYDEQQPFGVQRSNITRVIDAKGQVIVENSFGREPGTTGFNRVVRQYFMGGEYFFSYRTVRFIPPYDEHVNDAAMEVELLEPDRPLKLYTFNFRGNLLDERFRLCADGSYRVCATAYRYNGDGQLTTRFLPNGMAEVCRYDEANADPLARGNLITMDLASQPTGLLTRRIATLTYEPVFHKVKTIADEAGAKTTFVYDYESHPLTRKGDLVEIQYPDVTLPDGTRQTNCVVTRRHDQFGQVIEEVSAEGRRTTFEYYLAGNGAGLVRRHSAFDAGTTVWGAFEYDALGNLSKSVDRGNEAIAVYNLLGQLVEYQRPAVSGTRAVFRYEYNEDLKVAKEYVPRGAYTDAVIDGPWITHEYHYDVTSRLVRDVRNSNTAVPQVTTYHRDVNGNVTQIRGPLGHESRFAYDERGLLLRETAFATSAAPLVSRCSYDRTGNLVRVIRADDTEIRFDYNETFTRLTSRSDASGVRKTYVYGANDDVVSVSVADSSGHMVRATRYTYDERRRLVALDVNGIAQRIFHDRDDCVVRMVNHLGHALRFSVDGLRRTVGITDPLGNTTASVLDAGDNVRHTSTAVPSASGSRVQMFQALEFDERSRPVRAVDVLGNVFTRAYDDRNLTTELVDAYGNRCRLSHDVNGLPVQSAIVVDGVATTLYRWHRDLVGREVGFEDAEGNLTRYEYDERNNLARIAYPDGTAIERTYDAANFLHTERDPNGTVTTYAYDGAGRLSSLTFQEGPNVAPTPPVRYIYDTFGRLARLEKGTTTIERRFDAFDRVIEERQSAFSLRRIFDDTANTKTVVYSDGREDLHVFDPVGRLTEIVFKKKGAGNLVATEFAEGTKLVEFGYEGALRVSTRLANGTLTTYGYDADGKLASVEATDAAAAVIYRERYLYDGEKRRRFVQRGPLAGCNTLLSYDALSRLRACHAGVPALSGTVSPSDQAAIDALIGSVATQNATMTELYTLSANDRRAAWSEDGVTFAPTYNARLAVSQLQASNGNTVSFAYDLNGNRLEDDSFTYAYDTFDNLVSVTEKASALKVLEQIFDAEGRIVETRRLGNVTTCVFDGLRAIERIEGQSRRQAVYGMNLDDLVLQSSPGNNYFGHVNDANSLQAVSDGAGHLAQSYCYAPFGRPSVFDPHGNPVGAASAVVEPMFTGRPYIPELGLYEFRKRMYDPALGAFLQPDIYNYAESPNPYLYCKHNPVGFADPTGTIVPLLIAIGILSAEGGLTALGATVVGGAIVGGVSGLGLNAARQHVQLQANEGRTEFSLSEMFVSGAMGIVAGAAFPLLIAASPGIAMVVGGALIGKGIYDGAVEVSNGHLYTAGFDLATALLLPFAGKKLGNVGPRTTTTMNVNGQIVRSKVVPQVYSVQGDRAKLLPDLWGSSRSGRVWGMTEGSVYAHEVPNAPWWMTMVDRKKDPVILKFVGENAEVFKPHETTGIFSLMKRTLGQSNAGFGDLTFENAVYTGAMQMVATKGGRPQLAPIVELHGVKLAAGSFAGQSQTRAWLRQSVRQGLFDQPLNVLIGTALNNTPRQIDAVLSDLLPPKGISPAKN